MDYCLLLQGVTLSFIFFCLTDIIAMLSLLIITLHSDWGRKWLRGLNTCVCVLKTLKHRCFLRTCFSVHTLQITCLLTLYTHSRGIEGRGEAQNVHRNKDTDRQPFLNLLHSLHLSGDTHSVSLSHTWWYYAAAFTHFSFHSWLSCYGAEKKKDKKRKACAHWQRYSEKHILIVSLTDVVPAQRCTDSGQTCICWQCKGVDTLCNLALWPASWPQC